MTMRKLGLAAIVAASVAATGCTTYPNQYGYDPYGYNNGYYNNGYYNDGYYVQPAPRRYYRTQRLSSAHVQWCYDRYRSYRSWDNTFQPYNGPRQQCWSPYS